MIKPIVKDQFFLGLKSTTADETDMSVAQDLLDTLAANKDECVGLAANMIGKTKRIIVIDNEGAPCVMLNPQIVRCSAPYEAHEGCLSLDGVRKTTRYRRIDVRYQDRLMHTHEETFSGWTAQIIQHEIDHCNGILI